MNSPRFLFSWPCVYRSLLLFLFWCVGHSSYAQPIVQTEPEILLFRAIYEGDSATVEQLLQQGVSANTLYFTNVTALGYAACKAKLCIVQSLVKHGAAVNAIIPLSLLPRTALGIAVVQRNQKTIEFLMSNGAKIDVEISTDGWWGGGLPKKMYYSALTQAVMANNPEAFTYLLEFNPDINRVSDGNEGYPVMGKTPLMIAAAYDREEMALTLIRKGSKVNDFGTSFFKPASTLSSPLMEAAMTGNTKLVKELIDHGADVNAKDSGNSNALICAGSKSRKNVAELLLSKGAQINSVNADGYNCLLASIALHHQDVYRLISNRASTIDQVYQIKGILAIRQAWQKPDTVKFVSELDFLLIENDLERLLLGKDKFVERVKDLNQAELYQQHRIQNIEFTQFVLSKGIDVHQQTSNQKTAIQLAQQLNLNETMELLLDSGANAASIPPAFLLKMAIENNNMTKLASYANLHLSSMKPAEKCELVSWAVCTENTKALRLLYAKGVKPNCSDSMGITPLHSAVFRGNEALVDTLLAMKADKSKRDKNNVQAFHIAHFLSKTNIAQKVKPDSLFTASVFDMTKSVAETELKELRVKDSFRGGQLNDGSIYVYSGAIEKTSKIRSPLLAWLNQPFNDSTKLKYAKGLFSRSFLVLNPNASGINTFKQNQNYTSYPVMAFSGRIEYKNGRNNSESANISGAFKIKSKESKSQSWDASASTFIDIAGASTTWLGSRAFWVGTASYAGAGGGWDNHCITVVGGKCYSFSDADPVTAKAGYSIRGEYRIPKVTLSENTFHVAFPGVKVINEPDCVPVKVVQNGQEKIIQPGKTVEFNRQKGDITIIDEWSDKVQASGSSGDGRMKRSIFTVIFPYTFDIDNPLGEDVSFQGRLKTYSSINSFRYLMEQGSDSLSGVELYSLATTVHLLSEKARDKYKPLIKAELIGVVEFFENTQLKDLNDALLSLVELNTVEKPEIINRLDAILQSGKTDSITKSAITVIRSQVNDLPVNDVLLKLKQYKKDYLTRFYKKVDAYNLLLLEYCLYIPVEQIKQQLVLERIPIFNDYLQQPAKERLKL
jgi:ankyrin repeat protein